MIIVERVLRARAGRQAPKPWMTPGTRYERQVEERQEWLAHMREQISTGELVVRQMTASERKRWPEHSKTLDQQATPERRTRRDAARRSKRQRAERQQSETPRV